MKQSTLELLEQITSPNDEQQALIDHIMGLLEQPLTWVSKDTISKCLGRIWILNNRK